VLRLGLHQTWTFARGDWFTQPPSESLSDKREATGYSRAVRVRNFAHKDLRKLYEDGIAKGVPPDSAGKLRKMFAFLDDMQAAGELKTLPILKAHILPGDRKGTWSLTVTGKTRLDE
jgi:toxin HigB-1